MKYIRTREDALAAAAEILDLPPAERPAQAEARLPLCLEAEARDLLRDCRDFLFRRSLEGPLASAAPIPPVPDEERALDALVTSLNALRFADLIRRVLPDLRHERWQVARAVLRGEAAIRDLLSEAIRARDDRTARAALDLAVAAARPAWVDRAGSLLATCRDALRSSGVKDSDTLRDEATRLFELAALEDARAEALLAGLATHPARSFVEVLRLQDLADAARSRPGDAA